mmetsp:Transcript_21071/g.27684  ORF Transcript_21071/g.27684 Transcript_21071/m.27684 type:complete len:210 (+) Transcript_21071:74-703(+)|eukprot:CAMPEP_0117807702 /NCGR_PEP_ID=MMETSP0948-20121206/19482_1 /TAXON_ID=44440 /ORGANISM="Chattonella subsalsa, Strain CCMP2191" /LENGTH=209 /DNA_ID=CAMNT_0005642741 /DNA_START=26 /DNA_END=655 /DNA_ORIENTATION=+
MSRKEGLKQMEKIVGSLLSRQDSIVFRDPVDWRGLGLYDYPQIIKKPMDLGTVKRKLDNEEYRSPAECAADVRLIWENCMTYNQDGSYYYNLAQVFSKRFEDKYAKVVDKEVFSQTDDDRLPTLAEKRGFEKSIRRLRMEQLGEVILLLDQRCPECLEKVEGIDELEISLDLIDARTFHEVNRRMQNFISEQGANKKSRNSSKRRADEM